MALSDLAIDIGIGIDKLPAIEGPVHSITISKKNGFYPNFSQLNSSTLNIIADACQ